MNMENLIKRAKQREPDAFTELMQSQMQNMYRTARAILMNDEDAADAIQETILVCWEKLKDLKEDKYFRTWMTRILINKCYEIIRTNQKITYMNELPEATTETDVSNLEWKEALAALNEKYRLVLVLFYAQGFQTKEIAKMLKIPNIVQKKAQDAFSQIRMEIKEENVKVMNMNKHKRTYPFWKTRAAAILLAGLLGGGSITALAAVYINWSHGMQNNMNVSNEQMVELQNAKDTPLSFPVVSDTQGGITASVAQCLVDDKTIRMAFYVEGYELPNNMEPELEDLYILLDGEQVSNYTWHFYNGIDRDANGNLIMADGSPAKEDEDGALIPNYQTADGKMEINLSLSPVDENGEAITDLSGRDITVKMKNFGETTGTWTLEWTLEGAGTVVEKELDAMLGNSKATVKAVQISPISVKVSYDFAPQLIYDIGVDENGKEVEYSDYAEPPKFVGVKMVDGTVYTEITDGGTFGYEDTESSVFTAKVSLRGVINPEEVKSLLFLRDDIILNEQGITEEQCYVVDIK